MDLRGLFLLDPDATFLNQGSFGACPRPVFEAYQRWHWIAPRRFFRGEEQVTPALRLRPRG
jgi:hypothetical protein